LFEAFGVVRIIVESWGAEKIGDTNQKLSFLAPFSFLGGGKASASINYHSLFMHRWWYK
jgi:hypothetical protein